MANDFWGNSKEIQRAENHLKKLEKKLNSINQLLKIDAANTALLTEKQTLLAASIGEAEAKLLALQAAEVAVQEQFAAGIAAQEQYAVLNEQILITNEQLAGLNAQMTTLNETNATFAEGMLLSQVSLATLRTEIENGNLALTTLMEQLALVVEEGGLHLQNLAMLVGMTGAAFKTAFEFDAVNAMMAFINGLLLVNENIPLTMEMLNLMGFTENMLSAAIWGAVNANNAFNQSLMNTGLQWETNAAIMESMRLSYADFGMTVNSVTASIQALKNSIIDGLYPVMFALLATGIHLNGIMLQLAGSTSLANSKTDNAAVSNTELFKSIVDCAGAANTMSGLFDVIGKHPILAGLTLLIGVFTTLYEKCEWFRQGVNGVLNGLISAANTLIAGLNFLPGVNIGFIPKLPMMAKGGTLYSGSAIVGERGPELLSMINGNARVTPLTSGQKNAVGGLGNTFAVTIENVNNYDTETDMRSLASTLMTEFEHLTTRKEAAFGLC